MFKSCDRFNYHPAAMIGNDKTRVLRYGNNRLIIYFKEQWEFACFDRVSFCTKMKKHPESIRVLREDYCDRRGLLFTGIISCYTISRKSWSSHIITTIYTCLLSLMILLVLYRLMMFSPNSKGKPKETIV